MKCDHQPRCDHHWPSVEMHLARIHRGPCGGWHYGDRACDVCVLLAVGAYDGEAA